VVSVFSPGQTSFAGGEISPAAHGREDAELYGRALARCENFIPQPLGSLLMRGGTVKVDGRAPGGARFLRVLTSWGQQFVVALRHLSARIYAPSGRVSSESVPPGTELIPEGDKAGQILSGREYDGERWLEVPTIVDIDLVIAGAGDHVLSLDVTSPGLRLIVTQGDGGTLVMSHQFHAAGHYVWPLALPLGPVKVKLTSTSQSVWGRWSNLSLVAAAGESATDLVTPWEEGDLADVQWVEDTAEDRVILVHPKRPPQVLKTGGSAGAWTLQPILFSGRPESWEGENWPGVVELYQNRLLLAATPADQRRLWGSKPNSFFDFTVDGNPDSAIDVKIPTKGRLHWLQGYRGLLMGSDVGEHSASGVLQAVPEVVPESTHGSAPRQAIVVGERLLFVARGGRAIRAMNYSLQEDGFTARSLTAAAEHLLRGGVKELHFAASPEPTLFALLETGEVRAFTADLAEGIVAAWRVELGAPVRSMAVAETTSGAEAWLAVDRASGAWVERLPLHEIEAVYLDAAAVRQVPADGVLTGLEHLEDETVRVVVGGAVELEEVVVQDGAVELDVEQWPELVGQQAVVGLPYRAIAKTLPRAGGNPRGTAQGAKRRNVKVRLRLNDSALPLVNGTRAPARSPETPMGSPEPGFTGDVEATCLGYGDGSITIEQDQPLRTEILAVFTNTAVHDV
jgi:hypothetical protein